MNKTLIIKSVGLIFDWAYSQSLSYICDNMIIRYYKSNYFITLLLFFFSFCIHPVFAQSPGGVSTNLVLWLKAGAGVYENKTGTNNEKPGNDTAEDGDGVQSWADQSGIRVNAATNRGNGAPTFRDNPTSNLNYHPVVEFDGVDDGLDFYNDYIFTGVAATGVQFFAVVRPDNAASSTKIRQYIYDFGFAANEGNGVVYGNTVYGFYSPTNHGGNALFPTHSRGGQSTLVNYFAQFGTNQTQGIRLNGNLQSSSIISLAALSATQIAENVIPGVTSGPVSIGRQSKSGAINADNRRFFQGAIAEIIFYNNSLSATNIQKIESYLALNYGIPLSGNYIDSDADIVWNTTSNATYQNDVVGIARDDNAAIYQKQSIDRNGTISIGLGTIALNNAANPNTFASDQSYMFWGHDNGALYSNGGVDLPAGIQTRLSRVWKVSEKVNGVSGDIGSVLWRMDLSAIPGNKRQEDLRLLIDSDGIFSSGSTILTGTLTGNIFEVFISGNILQDGNFFTLGSTNFNLTPLPVVLIGFTAKRVENNIVVNWKTMQDASLDYFLLEKSADTKQWILLGKIKAQLTENIGSIDYKITDDSPFYGNNYYRLTQIDYDGTITDNGIKVVNFETADKLAIDVFPNPTKGNVNINGPFLSQKKQDIHLQIFDAKGGLAFESRQNMEMLQTLLNQKIKSFAPGIYLMKFWINNQMVVKKLFIE